MLFDGAPRYPSVIAPIWSVLVIFWVNFLILKCHLAAKNGSLNSLITSAPPPQKKKKYDHMITSSCPNPNNPTDLGMSFNQGRPFSPFATWDPKRPANMRPNAFSSAIQMPLGRHWHGRIVVFQNTMGNKWHFWPRDPVISKYYATCSHVLSKLGETSTFTLLHYSKSTCYMLEEFLTNSLHLKFHPQSRKPDPCWLK